MSKQKSTNFEVKALERLSQIVERLNILIELSVLPLKIEGLEIGKADLEVLELCNMKNTTEDMARKLKKNRNAIGQALHRLKEKGLVRSIKIGDKTYHVRTGR
jgi:DNA-binding transcriptional ArsR family regulator